MSNAAPNGFQPTTEPVRRLVNGEFYAKRDKIFRAPIETKVEGGTNISVGFPVCHVSDYVDAENLVECLNASREVDDLKARAEQAERSVDVLESNARVQAKRLADTGRRLEELEKECCVLREVIMAPSEPDAIRLHREKCNALDRVFVLEEIARQSRAAMLRTRTASIAGCEEGYGKPEKWGDELFQSHGGLTAAIKAIDAALPQSRDVARAPT